MKKLYFLGTKEIGLVCLKYLYENLSTLNCGISGVLTNNRSVGQSSLESITDYCIKNHIKLIPDLKSLLKEEDADFIISVQYHQILRLEHINKARIIAVNLHMAPLPEYRGCNQFSFAIIDKKNEFGVTLHRIEEGIDDGDILFEKRFDIPADIFVQDLYQKAFSQSVLLFKENIANLINGKYTLKPQLELVKHRGTSFHKRKDIESVKRIDSSWDTEKQKLYFRATYFPPFHPPIFVTKGKEQILDMKWYSKQK